MRKFGWAAPRPNVLTTSSSLARAICGILWNGGLPTIINADPIKGLATCPSTLPRHASLLGVAPYLLVIARYLHLAKRGDEAIAVDEIDRDVSEVTSDTHVSIVPVSRRCRSSLLEGGSTTLRPPRDILAIAILQAVASDRRHQTCLEPITTRTILLLMYGAGLRVREVVSLNNASVDLAASLLTIQQTKFGKTRLVPVGPQLRDILERYASRLPAPLSDAPFFTTRRGARVKIDTLQQNFEIFRKQAGIVRNGGTGEQPRLHDLRHTFAVHRLTSWHQQGANANVLLSDDGDDFLRIVLLDAVSYAGNEPVERAGLAAQQRIHRVVIEYGGRIEQVTIIQAAALRTA